MSDEGYIGTKFETVYVGKDVPTDPRVAELVSWCQRFHRLGLSPIYGPGSAGNLSFRTARGFVISRTASFFDRITNEDFVEVGGVDLPGKRVNVIGKSQPSSETPMHHALYAARPDVHAVLHAHSDEILQNAERCGIAVTTREVAYGTPELGEQAVAAAKANEFFILRNHGFVSLGASIEEAGRRVLKVLKRVKANS